MEVPAYKKVSRPTLETVWMTAARMLAQRSKCKRAQVGCIVTDRKMRRVIANGYNGRAAGLDIECPGEQVDPCGCLHAEANALISSGSYQTDKVMFITLLPCERCATMIINSGFSRVVYYSEHEKQSGLKLMKRAGIIVEKHYEARDN